MYHIRTTNNQDINLIELKNKLKQKVEEGGFTASFSVRAINGRKYCHEVQVATVRLKDSKPYCGNHAGPCKTDPRFPRPHRNLKYLEGGDWVVFNDLVNDVLDELNISAKVDSSNCVMRLGKKRRVHYGQGHTFEGAWNEKGNAEDYQDWCGKLAPRSTAPAGTPALPMEQYA